MQDDLNDNLIQRINLADTIRRSAAIYRDKPALVYQGQTLTYTQLHQDINRVAAGLIEHGVGRGVFVGLLFRNCVDFFSVYYACARIGAVAVPLNPALDAAGATQILDEARPKVLVAQGELAAFAHGLVHHDSAVELVVVAATTDGSVAPSLPDSGVRR